MDWSRTKNILIFIFAALNIFLLIIIINIYFKDNISSKTLNDVIIALKSRNVSINCKIPDFNNNLGTLYYDKTEFDKLKLSKKLTNKSMPKDSSSIIVNTKTLDIKKNFFKYQNYSPSEKINIQNISEVTLYLKNILADMIPLSDFVIDHKEASNSSLNMLFVHKYKDFLVFDNYIKVSISNKGITYLECKYRKIKGMSSKRKIMPVHQVLLKNFKKSDPLIINNIQLGFKEYTFEPGTMELDDIPVWKVHIMGQVSRYFKSFTGEEIK